MWRFLKRIASDLGVTVRTIQRRMRKLVELGLVAIEPTFFSHGGRNANRYVLLQEPDLGRAEEDSSGRPLTFEEAMAEIGEWIDARLRELQLSESQILELSRKLRSCSSMHLEAWRETVERLLDGLI